MSDKKEDKTKIVRISKKAHTKAKVKASQEEKTLKEWLEDVIEKTA